MSIVSQEKTENKIPADKRVGIINISDTQIGLCSPEGGRTMLVPPGEGLCCLYHEYVSKFKDQRDYSEKPIWKLVEPNDVKQATEYKLKEVNDSPAKEIDRTFLDSFEVVVSTEDKETIERHIGTCSSIPTLDAAIASIKTKESISPELKAFIIKLIVNRMSKIKGQ